MARPKKDGQHMTLYLDRNIAEALRKYAEEKGQTITTATERILKAYLDDHFKNKNQ